ncbi:MAG: formate dehydrogenase subunit alpha [Candidatus Hermodarchaeota archaeon]
MKEILTTCVYCGVGCNMYLQVDNNRVVGVTPVKNHPVSQGKLCIKGYRMSEFVHHPDRLIKPLIRDNKKDPFREASWDEALDLVAKKLVEIKNKNGPGGLGFFSSAKLTNEENYVMQKLSRAVFKTNNVDHCARLCHASTVVGLAKSFGSGAMTNSINEVLDADCILISGSNTTEQHPVMGAKIYEAVQNGAKLIVVDCRTIQLAEYANYHLKQRPGTDVAWLNSFMHVIIEKGLEDKDFIENHTVDYDKLKALVMQDKYKPENTEKITGIPARDLREAAIMYAKSKNSSFIYSMGITQHTTGVDNVNSVANLQLLTGNIGRDGTGVNPLRGQNNVQGACDLGALVNVFSGYQAVTDPNNRAKMAKAWNISADEMDDKIGLTIVEMINAAHDGKIKSLYIMGENPIMSDPNANHVREALAKEELFLVVQDIFMTETAQLANVVLPGVSVAEKDGTFTSTERRVQRVRKAIEPIGDSRQDWWIIGEIAKRAGYDGLTYSEPKEIMDEITETTPIYGGLIYDRLEEWGLCWPCPDKSHPGTKYLYKDGNFSQKPNNRAIFWPIEFKEPTEIPDDEYPMVLTTGRLLFHWHTGTMTRRSETLNREYPHPFVEINPADYSKIIGIPKDKVREGYQHAQKVRVSTRRGAIELIPLVTSKITENTVFIPFHFHEAPANVLTNDALDPQAKIPEYKACACKIEKI